MKQRLLSLLALAACFCLLLTASIGLPIYIRPFYYAHIERCDLSSRSGYSNEEIREAYDEVLDYLTLPGTQFGAGVIPHSASGADHFADCKRLFLLNGGVLAGSAMVLVLLWVLRKRGTALPYRLGRRSAFFWAAVLALVVPVCIGIYAVMDFQRAFVLFHSICFPGKTNWLFDPNTDPIILVMPIEFFANCAILIGAGLLTGAIGIMAVSLLRDRGNDCDLSIMMRGE